MRGFAPDRPRMKKILSPVAGTVFKLQTSIGAVIHVDDEVMLIESMKMEIPVPAEAAGTVEEILVAEGDAVKEGQALLTLT
jgi:acetyl-CoA carboxylase biotin carboxyl carrier protein